MPDDGSVILSTLRLLPPRERESAERELVALGRSAALGEIAADVAHDVANPLFGVLGLVDLLIEDAAQGSEAETRLRLLHQTAVDMKGSVEALLDYARTAPGDGDAADAVEAARSAVALVRHGAGRSLAIEERYPGTPLVVACGRAELVQAVLHLLLAAREEGGAVEIAVADGAVRVAPAGAGGLRAAIACRIARDHRGTLARADGAWRLELPPV